MNVKDQKQWDHFKSINTSPYAQPVIDTVTEWSKLIEASIEEKGINETDFKVLAYQAAKDKHMSYAQMGFARNALRHQWIHGEKYKNHIEALGF